MTYTELYEHIYSNSDGIKGRINELDPETKAAWQILRMLNGRGGFDHWWDGIEADCQDEIFAEIQGILALETR